MKHKNFFKKSLAAIAAVCVMSPALLTGTALGAGAPERCDTLYSIGSVSKMYVVTAAMQLVDKGLIELEEPVVTYLPEFEMADPRYKDITVRMLMDHTSGLMGTTNGDSFLMEDNDPAAHDELLGYLKTQRLKADPGQNSCYCNDGFDLLELVVERVSGQDFTTYMTEHLIRPIGGTQTGSYVNAFQSPQQVGIYDKKGQPFAHEYHIGIGAGGILSTAYEVCRFGSTFFKGDTTLLSEKAKDRMLEDESTSSFDMHYALGWDDVDVYEGRGVKVVSKGGDLINQHAELLVAPEEKISVGVCLSGGSSTYGLLFASALMDIALEAQGVEVPAIPEPSYTLTDTIPEEVQAYAGYYACSSGIVEVTFPDGAYMRAVELDTDTSNEAFYQYTEDGRFVRMVGDPARGTMIPDSDPTILTFLEEDGRMVVAAEEHMTYAELGAVRLSSYEYEQLRPGTASESAKAAWAARSGRYYLISGKYSNMLFAEGGIEADVFLSEADDGYVRVQYGVEQIVDATHAKAVCTVPGSGSRDLSDFSVVKRDGKELLAMDGTGQLYLNENDMPEITGDKNEVAFSKRDAQWYTIGEDYAGQMVTIDRTAKTAVYILDQSNACTYSSYMSGFDTAIPLPTGGKILFLGEPGEKITMELVK